MERGEVFLGSGALGRIFQLVLGISRHGDSVWAVRACQ